MKNSSLGSVLSWIFSILMVILGIAFIGTDSIVSGVVLLVGGLLICPLAAEFLRTKANLAMTGGLKVAIVIVFFIMAFFCMPATDTNPVTPVSEPQSMDVIDTPSDSVGTPEEEEARVAEEELVREEEKADLELLGEAEVTQDEFTKYIEGKVRNNTSHEYSYVQVTFNLYDDDGALIDTTLDNVNNLEAGGIWKFKAMVLNDEATSFKLSDLSGF